MLLPNGIRVVIEIDGKQHYSEGDISSPKLYAEMMVDTRKLQLKGYEVYRLGGAMSLWTVSKWNKWFVIFLRCYLKSILYRNTEKEVEKYTFEE